MLPLFSPNQFYKKYGTALLGLCLSFTSFSQTTPLTPPPSVEYPGILDSLEKLIQIDNTKIIKKTELLIKANKVLQNATGISSVELDPDFLNSVILHSSPSYVKLASGSRCLFFHALINDLLKGHEGKIKNIIITYQNKNQQFESGILSKKDFMNNVVASECPESAALIDQFQIKNLDKTIASANFEQPTGKEQCHIAFGDWLTNSKTPYFCKLHEFIKEVKNGQGDPSDLAQRTAISKILEKKLSSPQQDYLETLCESLDHEDNFCQDFLNVSFWTKVAIGSENKIYAEDICSQVMGTNNVSPDQLKQCLSKMRKENDLCLYPAGRSQGLTPMPQCDTLATALNYSSMRSDYRDCPVSSDQQIITNMGRILLNISKEPLAPVTGPCSAISTGVTFEFNKRFNNDEGWKLEACYDDAIAEKEVCQKIFYGSYGNQPESLTNVVADILKKTRGADQSVKCKMVDSEDYNSILLEFKSGCYIVFDRSKCFVSQCKTKIIYNDRIINHIKLKNRVAIDYFPSSISNERFSQHYLLTRDYRQNGRSLNSLIGINGFFKKSKKGIIHGVGCAEDLLPSFFKAQAFNQCSPLPFIIDGMIRENDKTIFVTRTALDSLQAPRLINWSLVFSAVKSYQRIHPLRLWTLYGLD
jgi:hypothetical protein